MTQSEQSTASSSTGDAHDIFEQLCMLYKSLIHGGVEEYLGERLRNAQAFVSLCNQLKSEDATVVEQLAKDAITGQSYLRRNAAARFITLNASRFPRMLELLRDALIRHDGFLLDSKLMSIVWKGSSPKDIDVRDAGDYKSFYFRQALLSIRSQQSQQLFDTLWEQNLLNGSEITALSKWNNPDILRLIIRRWQNEGALAISYKHTMALEAAFFLALKHDRSYRMFLNRQLEVNDQLHSTQAAYYLALLGLPDALTTIITSLESVDANVLALSLDTAVCLKSAMLVPSLLLLVERQIFSEVTGESLADQSLRVLSLILGRCDLNEEFNVVGGYTHEYKVKCSLHYRNLFSQVLDSGRRYLGGIPLQLKDLANSLCSPHQGDVVCAAYNLQAITGEDHKFDVDEDIIGNLNAILDWIERSKDPSPVEDGYWAFMGERVEI